MKPLITRRRFLATTTTAAAAALAMPRVLTAQKSDTQLVVGTGEHRYEVQHHWPQLPDKYSWQITHNVAVDRDGLLYVTHEGRENLKEHPSIFVFDEKGKFVRAFGNQFQGGGHGLEVITEGKEQFLYVTAYQQVKSFAKLTLKGETVWEKHAPMDSGVYLKDEDTAPKRRWGADAFMPTNYAFLPDGGFFLADGYGSFRIHRYDKNGQWLSMFGKRGKGDGEFNTPHGIDLDDRPGRAPSVVVCDRANKRLQWFDLNGKHYLLVADTGDNGGIRKTLTLLVIEEPESLRDGDTLRPAWSINFRWPDGARDCEATAVDATSGEVLLISKKRVPPELFRLPLQPGDSVQTAQLVTTLSGINQPSEIDLRKNPVYGRYRSQITGADLSPNGRVLAVLNYRSIHLYVRAPGQDWRRAMQTLPSELNFPWLPQAEGIAFSADGRSLLIGSEQRPSPLLRYRVVP